MNIHLKRIEEIDAQTKALGNILKSGEYTAAGLSIDIAVGPRDTARQTASLELGLDLREVLDLLVIALRRTRKQRLSWAREDLDELQRFFSKQG